ncbi:hypothetical protein B0J13DRAFT_62527 [Dactylonectria estremocensis]|uniref:Zn(2)-C6 fungal-type domain-containing protein n=1 Tax=Dactylonectria estremocensis TaxID=1079267 RepID=A0A9P9J3S8_9HYPO|nr:hypothetical protein B0J13DRAFT_62527 [Dactylonectria estremocensis]
MPDSAVPRRPRKGTRSCAECRRRKVACSWTSEHNSTCRRCEERGSVCIAQVYSSPSTTTRRSSSNRDRVARLEQQLARLTSAVHGIESDLHPGTRKTSSPAVVREPALSGSDPDSDGESHVSDVPDIPDIEPPTYLNSLFNNSLLSSDSRDVGSVEESRVLKALARFSDIARAALQPLIPSKEDVAAIADHVTGWQEFVNIIIPVTSMTKTGPEILEEYDGMKRVTVDPIDLAAWLLSLAITVEQMPREVVSPSSASKWPANASSFSKAVAEAVERTIVSRDIFSGSFKGAETTLLLLRLHHALGYFMKAWLLLRRLLAISELIGLPHSTEERKSTLWECLCAMDKFSSLSFAFPSATRHYPRKEMPLVVDGKLSLPPYIYQLSYIAVELEDICGPQGKRLSDIELYEKTSKLDGDLRELMASAPGWWAAQDELSLPTTVLQYHHNYITMRVHATLSLRPVTSAEVSSSRAKCTEACSQVIRRYTQLSPLLPRGFFLRRPLDLQIITTMVVLILIDCGSELAESSLVPGILSQETKALVQQVIEVMEAVMDQPNTDYARQAIPTIRALIKLFSESETGRTNTSLSIRVPLLGKVHIRRRQPKPTNGPNATSQGIDSNLSQTAAAPPLTEPTPPVPMASNDPVFWEPLSWFIEEDSESMFRDVAMIEYFGNANMCNDTTMFDFNQP